MESRVTRLMKQAAIILHRDAGKSNGNDIVKSLKMSEVNFNLV